MAEPLRILVTGAAGQIAYSLIFMIARGSMLGDKQPIVLHLLELPAMREKLDALVMELEDLASPLIEKVVATTDTAEAFTDIDVALLVGARPRGKDMERKDLLTANAAIFKAQGQALEKYASKSVKVVVVGNPANTNCLIASHYAPSIPKSNFSALTRLDESRAKAQIAKRLGVPVRQIQNVIVWGNHSATQFPDARFAVQEGPDGVMGGVYDRCGADWLQGDFIATNQQRGKAVIMARGASSAASAASAICDHTRDWLQGSGGRIVSMAVVGQGEYDLTPGLVFSFPVICQGDGRFEIVKDFAIDDFARGKLAATEAELIDERDTALGFLEADASV